MLLRVDAFFEGCTKVINKLRDAGWVLVEFLVRFFGLGNDRVHSPDCFRLGFRFVGPDWHVAEFEKNRRLILGQVQVNGVTRVGREKRLQRFGGNVKPTVTNLFAGQFEKCLWCFRGVYAATGGGRRGLSGQRAREATDCPS